MTKNNGFKVAALAASIALAMAATSAMAAAPAAKQLPGQGKVMTGTVVADMTTPGTLGLAVTGSSVIDWGKGTATTDINSKGVAGFNIGAGGIVNVTGGALLNIDSTGNASQIFGALNSDSSVYVANSNGIIVGAGGSITATGEIGLIANTTFGTNAGFTGTAGSLNLNGAGGDVSVLSGASLDGGSVFISGGSNVNVDLGALAGGAATLTAGLSQNAAPATSNKSANVAITGGALAGGTIAAINSAGSASNAATLDLTGVTTDIAGLFTNAGDLKLSAGFAIDGGLVNNKTVTQLGGASMGSLVNNGAYAGGGFALTTTDGGISNNASMTNMGYVKIANGGDFVNNGLFDSTSDVDVYGGGNIVNNGDATLNYADIYEGGNFTNVGTMTAAGSVYVLNGSIANSGKLSVDWYLETGSDTGAGLGFTKGADYSISNTGTVTATGGDLRVSANSDNWGDRNGTGNDSTGSVSNTGILRVGTALGAGNLDLWANNDVNLAGIVQQFKASTSKFAALAATNVLGTLDIAAGDWDGGVLNTDGVATVATDLFAASADVRGAQVKLMSNLASDSYVNVIAGAKLDTDYAVRVAAGKTVSAGTSLYVDGDQAGDESNVIVQGTLEANDMRFGSNNTVSDVFTGPAGSLSLFDNGAAPTLQFAFSGAVKTVPYNNTPTNFRYNGLNVVTDGSVLGLTLNPVDYLTSGTSTGSAVNILVNGDVDLTSPVAATVFANGTAVTGVTNIPNTHLVLQSSGNINTVGNFYWPGYVYLGTVAADADGNALPGTLGFGTITTGGYFNNVLPGDVSGASGIHFITQIPMTFGGDVVTNANAWVNFGTDLLTQGYANGVLSMPFGFFGGTNTVGTVVTYGDLDASMFHTHAPTAAK